MWNWNIRQRLFARNAIGNTGRSTTSGYQPILLGSANAQLPPAEVSSTPLEFSKSRALLAVIQSEESLLRDGEKRDGVQKTDI